MASDPASTTREAALRRLLVERVEATSASGSRRSASAARPGPTRPRLQTALVTTFVSAAVLAVSVAALVLSQSPHVSPAGATRHGAGPHTGITGPVTSSPTPSTGAPDPAPTTTAPDPVPTNTQLIAHTGWHEITRDQLHAYVVASVFGKDDPANGAIWEEQAWLDMQCMASKGYLYDPISDGKGIGTTYAGSGLTTEQLQGYEDAMYGPQTDAPYDWRTAGCHGISVHETGQDNAH